MKGSTVPLFRAIPGVRIPLNALAFTLVEMLLPVEPPMWNRIGLLWDVDRNESLYDVVAALYYRDARARAGIIALAESKGILQVYVGGADDLDKLRSSLTATVNIALRPHDVWTVQLETVPIQNGKLDHTRLSAGHPLHILPKRLPCGLVVGS